MFKKILLILLILVGVTTFVLPPIIAADQEMAVIFLDVGQGDATLLKLPGRRLVLIDGGPNNLVLKRLGENLPFYRRKIDLILISHWHDDHVIGLIEVMKRYQVKQLLYIEGAPKSELTDYLLAQARRENVNIIALQNKATLKYSPDCFLNLLNPLSLGVKNNDNNSLVAKLDCRRQEFLFSGDNESAVEKKLLAINYDVRADVFKASHHGSKTSNTAEFLQAIQPRLIVISVGVDNKFNHPAPEVLKNIENLGIKVKRTDKNSSVIIRID